MQITFSNKNFKIPLSIWFFVFLFSIIYSFISITKHNHFQTFAWDLAFFDELIWKVSQGISPISSMGGLHILGDHFQPVLFFLAPFYWIFDDVRMLLIAQAIIAVVSVYPIYLLAIKVIKNHLISLSISFSFILFTGFQHSVLDGFHQSVFVVFFLGWIFYFLEKKQILWYWLSAIGLLLVKEEYALLLSAIGIAIYFFYKEKRVGCVTILIGIISFVAFIYLVIPYFQQGPYTHFGYGEVGKTPIDVVVTLATKPWIFIKLLFQPGVKIKTVFSSFLSFGFLPLLSPIILIPLAQQFIVRFIDTVSVHRWLNLNHYAFPLSPLLAVSTIYSIKKIKHKLKNNYFISFYILFFMVIQNTLFHGPINSVFKTQFYQTEVWERDTQLLLKQIPPGIIIASQNSLLPQIAHRAKFHLLPEVGDASYIAVDLHNGPNKYSPLSYEKTKELIDKLLEQKQYSLIWQSGESLLLKRN